MNEYERSLLETIIRERELNRFLMMVSRLLFFDLRSILHIYDLNKDASFVGGRKLFERLSMKITEGQKPFVIPATIYGFEDELVFARAVSVKLFDIAQTDGVIPDKSVDIEKALKQREKALIIGSGSGSSFYRMTDIGLEMYVPDGVLMEKELLWEKLLLLYTDKCFEERGCQGDILIPFVKCILCKHFRVGTDKDVQILTIKLSNAGADSAFAILEDALKVARVLAEKLTYKRLSFNQILIVNGILLLQKDRTIENIRDIEGKVKDPFLKWEAEDLRLKLIDKSDEFIRNLYREKITGNGIYTYPYRNMEAGDR